MRGIRFEGMHRMFKSSVHQVYLKGPEFYAVISHVRKTRLCSLFPYATKTTEGHFVQVTVLGTENSVLYP